MLQTAIILAGGFGTRLQAVVSDLPKPMASVNGKPFLTYQLNYLKQQGIKNVVLSVGYLAEKITDYYQSEFNGLKLIYVKESSPLGTGGGIRLAMEACADTDVLVMNGDSFFDVDLHRFYQFYTTTDADFALAMRRVHDASRYGTVHTNTANRIISFKEKTQQHREGHMNGGVYILNKELYMKHTPPETRFSIEKDLFEKQLHAFQIQGFESNGYFIDIGIPEDYKQAQDDFKRFTY